MHYRLSNAIIAQASAIPKLIAQKKEKDPQCLHCPGQHLKENCPAKDRKVECCNCARRPGTSSKQPDGIDHSPSNKKYPIYKATLTKATNKTNYGY